uniref:TSC22 domain family protein 3 n=1 Tax=Anabas testudineus TaxID=64144 RepID=A0AAQ6ISQ4_ANATE
RERKVKVHRTGVRESWPGARLTAPTCVAQPITRVSPRTNNQSQPPLTLPAPHPHWSIHPGAPLTGRGSDSTMMSLLLFFHSVSSSSLIAIDNKIEQAMDLVKSHLLQAVREEVELLRDQIRDLQEKNQ